MAITDHERLDGALRAREIHAAGDFHFDLVVGEEITTRRGHVLALFLEERIPALRPLPETLERIHDQGGLAIAAASAGAADSQPRPPQPALASTTTPIRGTTWTRSSCSTPAPPVARAGWSATALNERILHLAAVGNSDAHVLEHVGTGWTWFPGTTAADYRRAIADRATEPAGEHWSSWHNVSVYGRQLVAKARHLRHTLRPTGEWR